VLLIFLPNDYFFLQTDFLSVKSTFKFLKRNFKLALRACLRNRAFKSKRAFGQKLYF
jgi:hypothetical protein